MHDSVLRRLSHYTAHARLAVPTSLHEQGMATCGTLGELNKDVLKAYLRQNDLLVGGNKAALVERVSKHVLAKVGVPQDAAGTHGSSARCWAAAIRAAHPYAFSNRCQSLSYLTAAYIPHLECCI